LVIGILAILIGVFAVATGRGGELAYEHADHAPLDLGPVTATDVALLRPPTALWGYNMQVTDEALDSIARALRDRDIEIAFLQRQLAGLGHEQPQDGERESWYADTARRDFLPKHERPPLVEEPPTEPQPDASQTQEIPEADEANEPAEANEPDRSETTEPDQAEGQDVQDEQVPQPDSDEAAAEEQGW
jgi:hypothetical protein